MKRRFAIPILLGFLALSKGAVARLGVIDPVPAATVLIPYFEVDLDACGTGRNTVITVTNATPETTLAHITLWTNLSIPSLDFDIYLTGFDVETLDLGDAFCNGNIPITAPDQAMSPHGPLSEPLAAVPSCDAFFPFVNPALNNSLLTRIRNGHTGQPVTSNLCLSADDGSGMAVGYVTIDVVNRCSVLFPTSVGYFSSVASFENRLLGEYVLYDPGAGEVERFDAVHIEADPTGLEYTAGDRTFYGHLVGGDASDRREPLPTVFATRFLAIDGDTEVHVWREGVPTGDGVPISCGTFPAGMPFGQNDLTVVDESGQATAVPVSLPFAINRFSVDGAGISSPSGWLRLDERHTANQAIYGDDHAQAWVHVAVSTGGLVSTREAVQLEIPAP